MERTKQPQNAKRRRQWVGRIGQKGPLKVRNETREDRFRFAKHAAGRGYLPGPKGKRMKKLHEKRRAAAKRARISRKKNRR